MEIRTPKIIPGESEGGAGVFTTDYFGRVRLFFSAVDISGQRMSLDATRSFTSIPCYILFELRLQYLVFWW